MATATTTTVKTGFIGRVLTALKGGDEVIIGNLQASAIKSWENQVKLATKAKAKLTDDLKDMQEKATEDIKKANEKLDDAFVNIDLTVKGREDREAYVNSTYEAQIGRAQSTVDRLAADLKKAEELAAEQQKSLDATIKRYNGYIAKIK